MKNKIFVIFAIVILIVISVSCSHTNGDDDFYKLLGVARDASVKEIRKAFKVLAVKLHPDKNKDDPDADAKFVKIAKAYEILKDPDSRKKYDLYGETGDSNQNTKHKYHSYKYYTEEFGIYDDDELIVTLSKADYEVNVLDKNQAWFVNFYSPHCHHCHELAPTWRKLAAELEGVIRIAAVNCEDDWSLCYQLGIQSYPTLLYYEKEAHLYEGEKFIGTRTLEVLKDFVFSRVVVQVKHIASEDWEQNGYKKEKWLLFLCADDSLHCPEKETRIKLTASLEGLMSVGVVTDSQLCDKIYKQHTEIPVVFWKVNDTVELNTDDLVFAEVIPIEGSDAKEILDNVLNVLPNPKVLDENDFKEARNKLRKGEENPWLICFYIGTATDLNLQLKRLPALLPGFNIGLVHCGKSASLCAVNHVSRYPTWGIIKVGGAFELHHGRDVLYEVAAFARDSGTSTNLHALSPADFYSIVNEGSTWFIDWYAPWCPPCRKLLPELRRASQHFDSDKVRFGTIDCTLHSKLCSQEGIRSYPTTRLYNGSQIHHFHGVPNEAGIVEFVQDMINPLVISLDENSFTRLSRKDANELWIVDYFAPWCAPCQTLASEWRNLAKQVAEFEDVKVAQVDCVANHRICESQNVHSYPTIRLYPLGSKGLRSVAIYNGHRNALALKRWILSFLPSPVIQLSAKGFKEEILTKDYDLPWLVDFYAPWCGHCTHFEPTFTSVAQKLEGQVRSGKVDCEEERNFCREMRVTAYPTVILFLSPTERHEVPSQFPSEIINRVKSLIEEKRLHDYGHDEL